MSHKNIEISYGQDGVCQLVFNRPDKRNALDGQMVAELCFIIEELALREDLRLVILSGQGSHFCAGADREWMRSMGEAPEAENLRDARALARLMAELEALPVPLIAKVQGGAYGGGLGILACCDIVIAADDARFGFPELRIGLAPATISPHLLRRCGPAIRPAMLTGEGFSAQRALELGLVHKIAAEPMLEAAVTQVRSEILCAAPAATRAFKQLLRSLASGHAAPGDAPALLARLRASHEAREGIAAAGDKRPASWMPQ
jgi:methylglutaconyl-CoA hydratase